MVRIKRIYEPASESDGYRILVDRLWPRGVSKESAVIDLWLKEIAPSTGLRKWFDHVPQRWRSFKTKYKQELEGNEVLVEKIRDINRQKGSITLLYSARDEKRNQAIVLQEFLSR